MEKSKRQIKLLIAFIIGVCFLIFWGVSTYNNEINPERLYKKYIDTIVVSREEYIQSFKDYGGEQYPLAFWRCLILFIIHIPAVLLSFFGWRKNDVKKTLIASILYYVSLNIPSAVLCLIGFSQLREENTQAVIKKKRSLAIIGIILPVVAICFLYLVQNTLSSRAFDESRNRLSDNVFNYEVYLEVKEEVYANTAIDEISYAFALCGLCLYPIFHYITLLIEGIRTKNEKKIGIIITGILLTVIGLFLLIKLLFDGILYMYWEYWLRPSSVHLLYYFAFAIAILVRSFRKAKVDSSHLDNTAVPETAGKRMTDTE